MHIEKILDVSNELFDAVNQLVPQLGRHKIAPAREELTLLVHSECSTLWIARYPDETGSIAGILTLALYRVPTGLRSIVEDVVVDQTLRRRGIAAALLRNAIAFARDAGASGVALTSNPQRRAANLLYQSLGFEPRDTNSYFYKIK